LKSNTGFGHSTVCNKSSGYKTVSKSLNKSLSDIIDKAVGLAPNCSQKTEHDRQNGGVFKLQFIAATFRSYTDPPSSFIGLLSSTSPVTREWDVL